MLSWISFVPDVTHDNLSFIEDLLDIQVHFNQIEKLVIYNRVVKHCDVTFPFTVICHETKYQLNDLDLMSIDCIIQDSQTFSVFKNYKLNLILENLPSHYIFDGLGLINKQSEVAKIFAEDCNS